MTASRDEESWAKAQPNLSLSPDLIWKIISQAPPRESLSLKLKLSKTCRHFHTFFKNDLEAVALENLLQAVIDDKKEKVMAMLNCRPELLLLVPNKNLIIESKYTWQKFYAEPALTMALKRNQIEMAKILLPYFGELEHQGKIENARDAALARWPDAAAQLAQWPLITYQLIDEYMDHLDYLIKVFERDRFVNGRLSDETEKALDYLLFNILIPETPMKLDGFSVEYLYTLASLRFSRFIDQPKRNAFTLRVMGLLQRVLPPEAARCYCEQDIDRLDSDYSNTGLRASMLKLKNGGGYVDFYPQSRDDRSGLGFDFVGEEGQAKTTEISFRYANFKKLRLDARSELKKQLYLNPTEIFAKPKISSCVIL